MSFLIIMNFIVNFLIVLLIAACAYMITCICFDKVLRKSKYGMKFISYSPFFHPSKQRVERAEHLKGDQDKLTSFLVDGVLETAKEKTK